MTAAMKQARLDTLAPGATFYRERERERLGIVVQHTAGGTLVEMREPREIIIRGEVVARTTTRTRMQFARASNVWIEE